MTHMAMSSIRVMATCALLGEAVGKAASLAVKNGISAHDVYLQKIDRLQELLLLNDCFLPSKRREISALCRGASLCVDAEQLRSGEDRGHKNYGTTEQSARYEARKGERITYTFERSAVSSVHIVFDSDLNRVTQDGGVVDRTHNTRILKKLDSPDLHMPKTLCREFKLIGMRDGAETEILHVTDNRKRAYDLSIAGEFDGLTLIPLERWGEGEKISVISFDFA
jgi:hypothetical protein